MVSSGTSKENTSCQSDDRESEQALAGPERGRLALHEPCSQATRRATNTPHTTWEVYLAVMHHWFLPVLPHWLAATHCVCGSESGPLARSLASSSSKELATPVAAFYAFAADNTIKEPLNECILCR